MSSTAVKMRSESSPGRAHPGPGDGKQRHGERRLAGTQHCTTLLHYRLAGAQPLRWTLSTGGLSRRSSAPTSPDFSHEGMMTKREWCSPSSCRPWMAGWVGGEGRGGGRTLSLHRRLITFLLAVHVAHFDLCKTL